MGNLRGPLFGSHIHTWHHSARPWCSASPQPTAPTHQLKQTEGCMPGEGGKGRRIAPDLLVEHVQTHQKHNSIHCTHDFKHYRYEAIRNSIASTSQLTSLLHLLSVSLLRLQHLCQFINLTVLCLELQGKQVHKYHVVPPPPPPSLGAKTAAKMGSRGNILATAINLLHLAFAGYSMLT